MSAAVTESPKPAAKNASVPPPLPVALHWREESGLISIFTLVLWLGCLAIGIIGFGLPYLRPQPPAKTPPPVIAQLLDVELTSDPLPPVNPAPAPPNLLQPPPLAKPANVPSAPPMMAVAAPSPQIAFAVPIDAPARVVPVKEASFRTVESAPVVPTPTPPAPQPLTFGQGEGKQPAPNYPRQALREGQEGVVIVRMTVREDGRVLAAEAASPSPWPLLNDAALRAVKSRWRFAPGAVRAYEVAIRFQLNR